VRPQDGLPGVAAQQDAEYKSGGRRERFASLCRDIAVRRLTFGTCMNKNPVHARPRAHIKTGPKNPAHLLRPVSPA